MTFNDLCNRVAGELPEGWQLDINLERDSGWVELTDDEGTDHVFPSTRESTEQEVLDALEYAKDQESCSKK